MPHRKHDAFVPLPAPSRRVDDDADRLLVLALHLMHTAGDANSRQYADVIRRLRDQPAEAATIVQRWINAAPDQPLVRWSLLHILTVIEDPACLKTLLREARRRRPAPPAAKGVCEQPSDTEATVGIMAIEGLCRLASNGNQEAIAGLIDVLKQHRRRSLRRPAARAVLAVRPDRRGDLEQILGTDRLLLNLRPAGRTDLVVAASRDAVRRKRPQ